jgi:hypothetical protein
MTGDSRAVYHESGDASHGYDGHRNNRQTRVYRDVQGANEFDAGLKDQQRATSGPVSRGPQPTRFMAREPVECLAGNMLRFGARMVLADPVIRPHPRHSPYCVKDVFRRN